MYNGKTLEEIRKMPIQEFAKLLRSRQKRSVMRRYEEIQKFLNRMEKKNKTGKKIRTHKRDMPVMPQMIGHTISVYNGREFMPIKISEKMIGHFLGEFAMTRRRIQHGAPGVGATKSSAAVKSKPK